MVVNTFNLIRCFALTQILSRAQNPVICKGNFIIQAVKMSSSALNNVPKVDIDPNGVFKYILLNVHDANKKGDEETITIVRGYQRHNYHSDIYDEVQAKLHPLDCEPIGGGRISHQPDQKKIHIYGYSQGYGKADHKIAAKMIKDVYPDYTITVSDEGY